MSLEFVSIGDLVLPIATWVPTSSDVEATFDYLDLSSVDQARKEIRQPTAVPCVRAPSRARQLVASGDVLVSTVRPNLNAVALVPAYLDGAIASTGFCVLRSNKRLSSRYLFHWVRSGSFVNNMTSRATGASYPAVSDRIIKSSRIPLPSLPEQLRIADMLDRIVALRAKNEIALFVLQDLTQSIFFDMFGDPIRNDRSWPIERLGDLGSLERGVSKHRPRNSPDLLGGAYPFVQTGDVSNSDGYITEHRSSYSRLGLSQSKLWPAGTLCITIAANIAKTGILTFDACFPDSVVGFSADSATTSYVQTWLSFLQKTIEEAAPESAQKNINLAILRNLKLPVPPTSLRELFANRIHHVEDLKRIQRLRLTLLDLLAEALSKKAFRGEL